MTNDKVLRSSILVAFTTLLATTVGCAADPKEASGESESAQTVGAPGTYVPPYDPPKEKSIGLPLPDVGLPEIPISGTYDSGCPHEGAGCLVKPNLSLGVALGVCRQGTCKKRGGPVLPNGLVCEFDTYSPEIACDAPSKVTDCVNEWFDGRDRVTNEDPKANDVCAHGSYWAAGAGKTSKWDKMGSYFASRCLDQIVKTCQGNPSIPACKNVGDVTKCSGYKPL